MMVSHDVAAVPLHGGLIAHTVRASCAFGSSGPCASLPLDFRSRCAAFARGLDTPIAGETVTAVTVPAPTYPVQFAVDYPDRALNRLTTALRLIVAIPILV